MSQNSASTNTTSFIISSQESLNTNINHNNNTAIANGIGNKQPIPCNNQESTNVAADNMTISDPAHQFSGHYSDIQPLDGSSLNNVGMINRQQLQSRLNNQSHQQLQTPATSNGLKSVYSDDTQFKNSSLDGPSSSSPVGGSGVGGARSSLASDTFSRHSFQSSTSDVTGTTFELNCSTESATRKPGSDCADTQNSKLPIAFTNGVSNDPESLYGRHNSPAKFDTVIISSKNSSSPSSPTNSSLHQPSLLGTSTKRPTSFQITSLPPNTNGYSGSLGSTLDSRNNSMVPIDVKSMLLHGVDSKEILASWLQSIKCDEYLDNFIQHGYDDMPLLTRMTPQDLTAIGCKSPAVRKKLLQEIKRLNLEDNIPDSSRGDVTVWLDMLKMKDYQRALCAEGYNTIEKICTLTWEDLEEIGIVKLGHQKRLILGIEKLVKSAKTASNNITTNQHSNLHDNDADYNGSVQSDNYGSLYGNHRMSLNNNNADYNIYSSNHNHNNNTLTNNRGYNNTVGRSGTLRSGFFQKKSSASVDKRGLPVATVMPALKHVNSSLANLDISAPMSDPTKLSLRLQAGGISDLGNSATSPVTSDAGMNSSMVKKNSPPMPPTRTNSLRLDGEQETGSAIYGTIGHGGAGLEQVSSTSGGLGSTSFLRTPKLGTLTATTNKMLTAGGHIQTLSRPMVPIREVPLPPVPGQLHVQQVPVAIPADNSMAVYNQPNNITCIEHQLGRPEEFPPPPPS